jgi:hypothetical protein
LIAAWPDRDVETVRRAVRRPTRAEGREPSAAD